MVTILSDTINDQNYDPKKLTTSNPAKAYIEQIKMGLETETGTIMGSESFFNLESLVFEQDLDANQIKGKVLDVLRNFCSLYVSFQTDVDVNFALGELRDICLINVIVNGTEPVRILVQ